ncbi:hypothetical protein HOLleu_06441 [Holothuria leucospilota]|uniref:Uncharacterized protein n=1 Tax=Holothuria leucospilota TaxID=206669 RepID=A0A9Q1HIX4_HOLLE|nr:hypothetical protein HOLleu_06441 [Holothuria leucospilota]
MGFECLYGCRLFLLMQRSYLESFPEVSAGTARIAQLISCPWQDISGVYNTDIDFCCV